MPVKLHSLLILCVATLASADYNSSWDEFTNNFASDLAPIIALFGEQATKQFLSESSSIWDCIIFSVAPLGILTAVVSVIRIYGDSSLKSFIGRSQEAHGVAEAELCSSTSEDVCELWSNGGICRVFGRPKILEIKFAKPYGNDCFYPEYASNKNENLTLKEDSYHCGIKRPVDDFKSLCSFLDSSGENGTGAGDQPGKTESAQNWREVGGRKDRRKDEPNFAKYPNLSFNIGMKKSPGWVLWLCAISGVSLQASLIVFATIFTFHRPHLYESGKRPATWCFILLVTGTISTFFGMFLCANLIDQKSCERRFERKSGTDTFFWLQPGGQRIGDQLFNKFAYSANRKDYITSWKDEKGMSLPVRIALWAAVLLSIGGWACQFVGLRGLHGSVALYQLVSTVIMSIIRASLRARRLSREDNRLEGYDREIEGHELDWQAFSLEHPEPSKALEWHIVDSSEDKLSSSESDPSIGKRQGGAILGRGKRIKGFYWTEPSIKSAKGENKVSVINTALVWLKEQEHAASNEGARLMRFRTRLAHLTSPPIQTEEQAWNTTTRSIASCLQEALEQCTEYVFAHIVPTDWMNLSAITWSTTCQLSNSDHPIYFHMYCVDGRWRIDKDQLEAVLGLWMWSLKQSLTQPENQSTRRLIFDKKSIIVHAEEKDNMISTLNLWVTQSQKISVEPIPDTPVIPASILSIPSRTLIFQTNTPQTEPGSQLKETKHNKFNISIGTRSLPLQMLAQDIFTTFMSRLGDIIEPFTDIANRQLESLGLNMLSPSTQPYLGLVNPHIDELVRILTTTGVAPRGDALMSIIPALTPKLPSLDSIADILLRQAKTLTSSAKFEEGQRLLQALCFSGPPNLKPKAVWALAELYRLAFKSPDESSQSFGRFGLEALAELDEDISKRYIRVLDHFKNPKPIAEFSEEFMRNLETIGEAREESLVLSLKYDLTRACSKKEDLIKILVQWAIKHNCAELLGDLQNIDKGIIKWMDDKSQTPIFWAIESRTNNDDALECIMDWPDLDIDHASSNGDMPLHRAVAFNHYNAVEGLLAKKASLVIRNKDNFTPIEIAANSNHDRILNLMLNSARGISNYASGATNALLLALKSGLKETSLTLANFGAKVDNGAIKSLPLDEAILHDIINIQFLDSMFRAGLNMDTKLDLEKLKGSLRGGSFLGAAAWLGKIEVVQRLVDSWNVTVDLELDDPGCNTALEAAAVSGNLEVVQFLIQKGNGDMDFHLQCGGDEGAALNSKTLDVVQWLVQEGKATVEFYLRHYVGSTFLKAKVRSRNLSPVQSLAQDWKTVVDFQIEDREFGSVLAIAAILGLLEIVQWLIKKGKADVDLLLQHGRYGSALTAAAYRGNLEIVQWLVKEGKANVDLPLQCGDYGSALVAAAYEGELEIVQWLVKEGKANVDLPLQYGHYGSALIAAVDRGELEIVQWLVEEGKANVDLPLQYGHYGSALIAAVYRGELEIVQWLVEEGKANVDLPLQYGHYGSALVAAAYEGDLDIVQWLVKKGKANVDLPLQCGHYGSALVAAAYEGELEVVQWLVKWGKADVNLEVNSGKYRNAIFAAFTKNKYKICRWLIQEGGAAVDWDALSQETSRSEEDWKSLLWG